LSETSICEHILAWSIDVFAGSTPSLVGETLQFLQPDKVTSFGRGYLGSNLGPNVAFFN